MRAKWNSPHEVLRESQDIWEAIDNVTVVITTFEHKKVVCLRGNHTLFHWNLLFLMAKIKWNPWLQNI